MSRTEKQDRNKALGRICEVDGCETGVFQAGLCGYHHAAAKVARRAARGEVCSVDGCERGKFARGLCRGHYSTEWYREHRAEERREERIATALADLDDPGVARLLGRLPAAERRRLLREHTARDAGRGLP